MFNIIFIVVIIFIIVKQVKSSSKIDSSPVTMGNIKIQNSSQYTLNPIYNLNDKQLLEQMVRSELKKQNVEKIKLKSVENIKIILTCIFSLLNIVFICCIFFHTFSYKYLFEILNIIVYIIMMNKVNTVSYLKKQIKARPDEKISYIISSKVQGSGKSLLFIRMIIIIVSFFSILFFIKPHTFYEKTDEGYYVRFYTYGITNFETVTIPSTYKNEKVIGIRGKVFSNMKLIKEINLPDSIEVIRGRAFENDYSLEKINLPRNLTYLGGSAFKNCSSLVSIEIPSGVKEINGSTFEGCSSLKYVKLHDNITSIHGSAFKNCSDLEEIKLPKNITEIRGNTFEECTSLKSIDIPYGVTRIGGHAFYGCTNLRSVKVPSTVKEIGSSAFRKCLSLDIINIPEDTIVNDRAFKESPTLVYRYQDE